MQCSFTLAPGEELQQCPYNKSHQVIAARIITHLNKCRRSYVKSVNEESRILLVSVCRFNATHHVLAIEQEIHEKFCKDRFNVIPHLGTIHGSANGGQQGSQGATAKGASAVLNSTPIESTEDWESESAGYTPGYDPTPKLQSEVVMYTPSGLTKSERRKFRKAIAERVAMATEDEQLNLPTAIEFNTNAIVGSSGERGRTKVVPEERQEQRSMTTGNCGAAKVTMPREADAWQVVGKKGGKSSERQGSQGNMGAWGNNGSPGTNYFNKKK